MLKTGIGWRDFPTERGASEKTVRRRLEAWTDAAVGGFRGPVERTIAWLKQYRRVGFRRDRNDAIYRSLVNLACAMVACKTLAF